MQIKSIQLTPKMNVVHQSELIYLRRQVNTMKQQIEALMVQHSSTESVAQNTAPTLIKLPSENGFQWIDINSIIYCQAQGNYCAIFVMEDCEDATTKKFLVSKTLKKFSEELPNSSFVRCHQSYLVNKKHVLQSTIKSGLWLTMCNQHNVPVSRRRKHMLMELS